jgi:hypothetical protein
MDQGVYTVAKEAREWTISADGIRIIACRDRRTAIKTVRRATALLRKDEMARNAPGRQARSSDTTTGDLHMALPTDPAGYDLPDAAAVALPA